MPIQKKVKDKNAVSPNRPGWRKISALALIWGVITLCGVFAYYSYGLPDIEDIHQIAKQRSIIIKAADGEIIATYGDVYGDFLKYHDFPEYLVQAVIATEDRRFFRHHGFDIFGIARAAYANYKAGRLVQGGSTITQQLAKNVFVGSEKTFRRKIQELILSLQLEMRFNKNLIMSTYLNRVYMGAGAYGADAAARRYFGKSARELSLPESAMIVGLLKAPSAYSPTSDEDKAERRAMQVIRNMQQAGYLNPEQAKKHLNVLEKGLEYAHTSFDTYYFADWLLEEIEALFGSTREDIVVETTLDTALQKLAENTLTNYISKNGAKLKIGQGAILALKPDGAVEAFVGGTSYRKSPYNRVSSAKRQAGSSFKPFVYLTAVKQGLRPDDIFEDEPVTIGKWKPRNYSGDYQGTVSVEEALAQSINTVAIKIAQQAGLQNVVNTAKSLGVLSPLKPYAAIALGTDSVNLLEMTAAYATFANGGYKATPYGIQKVYVQRSGKVLFQRKPVEHERLIEEEQVKIMNAMLVSVVNHGTGTNAKIGRPAAGKTGTSQNYSDAWFIGYTPQLVCGVWMGNDDNKPMRKVTGGSSPAIMWKGFMSAALKDQPVQEIPTDWNSNLVLDTIQSVRDGVMDALSPDKVIEEDLKNQDDSQSEATQTEPDGLNSIWEKITDSKVEHEYPGTH